MLEHFPSNTFTYEPVSVYLVTDFHGILEAIYALLCQNDHTQNPFHPMHSYVSIEPQVFNHPS